MKDNGTWLKVITKGNANPQGKPRVYFSCHPDDMEKYLSDISEQLFVASDCALYYCDADGPDYSDENWENDLSQMNLFVFPVTLRLLQGDNRSLDKDLPFANDKHIPVLPLMMEENLTGLFTEKFGEIQYLSPGVIDETAISYEEKLKTYLDGVLIGSDMRKRIQDAFDAYVFLSYRKKDRKYANELMHLIHKNELYRDIAIWYDEFLTPGEVFTDGIDEALKKSSLFALLVTPNLLEDPNYVMTTEYPAALELKKRILPVEMADTSYEVMSGKYDKLPEFVKGIYDDVFCRRLMKEMEGIATEKNDDDPVHNFLIGLAYLDGIDVEKDYDRAVKMITMAADAGLPEAVKKLALMYHDGIAIERNWESWVEWLERLLEITEKESGPDSEDTAHCMSDLAYAYHCIGKEEESAELYEKLMESFKRIYGEDDPNYLAVLNNLSVQYSLLGKTDRALELQKKVYESIKKIRGEDHRDTLNSLSNIASYYEDLRDYESSIKLRNEIYDRQKALLGDQHPETITSLQNMAVTLYRLGDTDRSIELLAKAYEMRKEVLGADHPDTLNTMQDLAFFYGELGWHKREIELYEKIYQYRKDIFGDEHSYTYDILYKLASACIEDQDFNAALNYYEELYDVECRIHGKESREPLASLNNIAFLYFQLGNPKMALKTFEEAYEIEKKVLGEEHPDTLATLDNINAIKEIPGID